MRNKSRKRQFLLILLGIIFLIGIAGCRQVEKGGIEMEYNEGSQTKSNLIDNILKLDPYLSEDELKKKNIEELENLQNKLKRSRKQKEEELIDRNKKEGNGEEHKHKYRKSDPNPPEPPIYEKPKPVPDPPIENE